MTEQTDITIPVTEPYEDMYNQIIRIHGTDAVESEVENLIHQMYQQTQAQPEG